MKIAFAVPGNIKTLTGGTIYDRRLIQELQSLGCTVKLLELPSSFPFPTQNDMALSVQLLAQIPANMPLIIDGLAFGALDPTEIKKLRAPLVPLIHHPLAEENGLSPEQQDHFYETERQNLTLAQHVLVPSPHIARLLATKYAVKHIDICVAQPGTEQPTLKTERSNPPLILCVGIQLPRKGHDVLIKALAKITDLPWRAEIVGAQRDPDFSKLLTSLTAEHKLEHRVRLAGEIEHSELATLYAKASIFALATRYEGYGIVFNEALTYGLPIVTCATGAVTQTVPPKAGLLTQIDDPQAFANALRKLMTEPETHAGCAKAALTAGKVLPSWRETAVTVLDVLKTRLALST